MYNPSLPHNQSSFSFPNLNSNPNPNPNPNLLYFPNQNPPPPPPDLSTSLSLIKDLIRHSQTTADSIFSLLRTTAPSDDLSQCPYNPHHRVPPESLFRHSLQCSSSPATIDIAILDSLHYPNTLQSSEDLIKQNQNRFVKSLNNSDAELCFSLDDYSEYRSNFFYRDCPGVFSSADQDNTTKRTFTLPGVLAAECANFVSSGENQIKGFSKERLRFLPSECWLVRAGFEVWQDYPTSYSYNILRTILCMVVEGDFLRWVLVNSPRYGIVIDLPLAKHILLLFRLCLKAITKEAVCSINALFSSDYKEWNVSTMSFSCPKLVEVMRWLSFQFSLLYGEANGKFFAIEMVKQLLLNASMNSSFIPVMQKVGEVNVVDGTIDKPQGRNVESEKHNIEDESINSRVIFVSQVAAAVAALQERSLVEEKIKAFQNALRLPYHQRVAEHAYITKRAEEERHKRCNYRPILEHDGLIWHQSRNQNTNKLKTREELLAEERDYKRRRMSYRGKKSKRSTTQVMRDIIEEYMDEIKEAGGIGCFVKGVEGTKTSEQFSAIEGSVDDDPRKTISNSYEDRKRKTIPNSYEGSRGQQHGSSTLSHPQDNNIFAKFEEEYPEDRKRHRGNSRGHLEHLEAHTSSSRDRDDRKSYSRSVDEYRGNVRSNEYSANQGRRGDLEISRKHFSQDMSRRSDMSQTRNSHPSEQNSKNLEVKNREQMNSLRNHKSDYARHYAFEDRYDPSAHYNTDEDDDSYEQICRTKFAADYNQK